MSDAKARPLSFLIFVAVFLLSPAIAFAQVKTGDAAASNPFSVLGDWTVGAAFAGISYSILTFSNFILYMAGSLFNWVVEYTVFGFANIIGGTVGLIAAWSVLRDIANIALLFGFIFIGVATILDIHGYEAKKTLPRLIIFAVLLNFSLLASQMVIDTSNIFSAAIYQQAGGQECNAIDKKACANNGISGKIAQMSGITTLFDFSQKSAETDASFTRWGITYLMMSVFVTITAVVLLAGAIMLIIRAVVLIFLMVLSPIGFAGLAIPPLEQHARTWWSKLISQSFFAPVFLLLILVSIKIAEGIQTSLKAPTLVHALTSGDVNTVQAVVLFAIFIGFMIMSLVAAQRIGAIGAGFAANASSALVYGSMAYGANTVVGGGSYLARKTIERKSKGGKVARAVVNYGFRPLENANLDMRRMPGMAAALGVGGITTGAKPVEHGTFKDVKHIYDGFRNMETNKRLNAQYDDERDALRLEKEAHGPGALSAASLKYLSGLSAKELEALHGIQEGLEKLAYNLSPEQFEALMKSEKLSDMQKGKLKEGRFAKLTGHAQDAANAANPTAKATEVAKVKAELKKLNKSDLENLPAALLEKQGAGEIVLAELSEKQREDLAGSKKRTGGERDNVRTSSPIGLLEEKFNNAPTLSAGARAVRSEIGNLTPAQVGQLDSKILIQPEVSEALTQPILTELQEKKKLKVKEMKAIGDNIRKSSAVAPKLKEFVTTGPGAAMWS